MAYAAVAHSFLEITLIVHSLAFYWTHSERLLLYWKIFYGPLDGTRAVIVSLKLAGIIRVPFAFNK